MKNYIFIGEQTYKTTNQPTNLHNEKTKLQTDYKHIEELAREKYRMAKKGEKVFKVIEKKEN